MSIDIEYVDFEKLTCQGCALIPDGYYDREWEAINWQVSDLFIWGLTKHDADAVARWFAEYRSKVELSPGNGGYDEWQITVYGLATAAAKSFVDWLEEEEPPRTIQ
jgi:hypothetical protein